MPIVFLSVDLIMGKEYNISVNEDKSYIKENIEEIRSRIESAAKRAGRKPSDITLLAVSKTFDAEFVREAYNCGLRNFGENYIQEALDKISKLEDISPCWHFTGHLQKNKVRAAIKHFSVIQSVDSPSLLRRIDQIAVSEGKRIQVLLHVDFNYQESKHGMDPQMVFTALEEAAQLKNTKIMGLMLLPPYYKNPEMNRDNFKKLKLLSEEITNLNCPSWENRFLSMGMSNDFEIAIEEGSNMVRIGTAIFGARRR